MIYAGVELGGTKTVAILARGPHDVLAREVIATSTPDETLRALERVVAGWKAGPGFGALGIASFGPIDLNRDSPTWGDILQTPKPGWAGTEVARRLGQAAGAPVVFDTDVNGAAMAEMRWGSGQALRDFAYITVGTGVGVGLIVDNKPTRGFGHCELGHVRVARFPGEEWPGSCPFHGDCVEGLASGSSLQARFGSVSELAAEHPVWESISWTLAQLCQVIVCAGAPGRIAIGGGVVTQRPHLLGRIQSRLVESLNGFIDLPADDYVCAPALGSDAGPLGAIALAMTAKAEA